MPRRRAWPAFSVFVVAALGLLLAAAGGAEASPFDAAGEDWEGLSQLVRLAQSEIGTERVRVPQSVELERLNPNDALLLVHPEHALDAPELAAFMRAGGRVVLLDDYGKGDSLLAHFGIRRVPLPSHPAEMLRGRPAFAIAEPVSVHAAVRDVARVVTNHATGLADTGLLPLLVVHGQNEPDVLLAVAGIVGKGRFLAIGDASVVMNAMLRYPGNHALASALLRYATEDSEALAVPGSSAGRLYIAAPDCMVRGRFTRRTALPGALGELQHAALEALAGAAHGMPPLMAYLAALAVGLGVVFWTSARAGRTHKAPTPRFVRPVPRVAQGGVAGHAAVLQARGTPRVLAILELKSALEEHLTARLGLERTPPHDELVAGVRARGLLAAPEALELSRLLAVLTSFETRLVRASPPRLGRVGNGQVIALARQVRGLLVAIDSRPA